MGYNVQQTTTISESKREHTVLSSGAADEQTDRWALVTGLATLRLADGWTIRPVEAFRQGSYPDNRETAADTAAAEAGAPTSSTDWLATRVPGHWQQEPQLADHAGCAVYRCLFQAPPPASSELAAHAEATRVWLRLNGAFYWSEPYLNGTSLGRHEGYFAPYEREITHLLDPGENTLLVEVESPDEHDKFDKRMLTGVFSHWDCFDPAANPGGIWLPVELHYSGPVRLQAARCATETFNRDFAQLRYMADLTSQTDGPVLLRWTLTPRTFSGPPQRIEQRRTLRAGQQTITGLLKLRNPRLWWTHDLGTPDLYTITLEVLQAGQVSDRFSFVFGVRLFELRNWIPHLNGVRFLAKGNNYPPGDMRIATMDSQRCAEDMRLARDCNMNMLRVHAHVDHPALYRAADEAGMLLWQDMPLQWLYRAAVLPEALQQAQEMVRLLYNHPSVAVWCMHNEAIFVNDTADETIPTRLRGYGATFGFSWNRDVMDTQLKFAAEEEDPHRPVVRSSGEFYLPFLKAGTDAHLYFGWYKSYGTLARAEGLRRSSLKPNLRFVTEFGAQSFPNVESCVKFMPASKEDIDVAHLAARHSFQAEVMSNWLAWRQARTLEELVTLTQDYQIFLNRYYIDRLRYHKYRPTGGILPFVFCDPYPAITWSILDYWRVPKRSYHAMRMAFNPQYAFCLFGPHAYRIAEPIDLPIYAVNDAQHACHNLHLRALLAAPDGAELALTERTFSLEADCLAQEIDRLRLTPTMPGRYVLQIALTGAAQETRHTYEIEVR